MFGRGFKFQARWHGNRSHRGSVKYEILSVLAEGPRHGYDIMQEIERQRGGMRPSPGSVYPALQMLEDTDAIQGADIDSKRVYTITDKGSELLGQHTAKGGFSAREEGKSIRQLITAGFKSLQGLKDAVQQAAKQALYSDSPEIFEKTVEIIERARREVYSVLADEF